MLGMFLYLLWRCIAAGYKDSRGFSAFRDDPPGGGPSRAGGNAFKVMARLAESCRDDDSTRQVTSEEAIRTSARCRPPSRGGRGACRSLCGTGWHR